MAAVLFYILQNSAQSSSFFLFVDSSNPNGCEVISHCFTVVIICILLLVSDVGYLFICFLAMCVSFWKKCLSPLPIINFLLLLSCILLLVFILLNVSGIQKYKKNNLLNTLIPIMQAKKENTTTLFEVSNILVLIIFHTPLSTKRITKHI